ncbi:ABC transporter permease [Actinotalea sp.]|uniref:ABC transporter permease n=1 Tax=Actinotalea sp. TaxID=1872145 RepID=UPI00356B005F
MSTIWAVARREVKARMLTRANLISMSLLVLLIAIGTGVGWYFQHRDTAPPVTRIALASETAPLAPVLEASAAAQEITLETTRMTAEVATEALLDGDTDAFLQGSPAAPEMLVARTADPSVLSLVSGAVGTYALDSAVSSLGGDPAAVAAALAAAVPSVTAVDPPTAEVDGAEFGVAMVMISLLFGALIGTGSTISMGVVEEKTSRVVEILLSTIRPAQLLAGKILGVGIYGLFQVFVLGAAGVGAAVVLGAGDLLQVSLGLSFLWLVVWFLLGYLLFALLFGGFAALVSRQEDIGSVTTPLIMLLLVPFYATMFLVPNDPESTLVRVLSIVPFFSPFMLPVRSALGALQGWEMALGLAVTVLTIPALVWIAGRVYRRGVLHTGGKLALREALRGA